MEASMCSESDLPGEYRIERGIDLFHDAHGDDSLVKHRVCKDDLSDDDQTHAPKVNFLNEAIGFNIEFRSCVRHLDRRGLCGRSVARLVLWTGTDPPRFDRRGTSQNDVFVRADGRGTGVPHRISV